MHECVCINRDTHDCQAMLTPITKSNKWKFISENIEWLSLFLYLLTRQRFSFNGNIFQNFIVTLNRFLIKSSITAALGGASQKCLIFYDLG